MLTDFGIGTLGRELVKANVKSKAPLRLIFASGPFDSNIREESLPNPDANVRIGPLGCLRRPIYPPLWGEFSYHQRFSESDVSPFDLTGRVAIVTGGNGGLGLAMARGLARAGASIAIAARDESKAQAAIKKLHAFAPRCRFYALQASSASSCRKLIENVVGDF